MTTKKLTPAQIGALEEATKGNLRYSMCGWTATGMRGFQRATVVALDRLRLLSIIPLPEKPLAGQYILTDLGRAALISGRADLSKARPRI